MLRISSAGLALLLAALIGLGGAVGAENKGKKAKKSQVEKSKKVGKKADKKGDKKVDSKSVKNKPVTTPSGLTYEDLVIGTGPSPRPGQTVEVHYTGWLTNGKKFDSSRDRGQPFAFVIGMGTVIKGWDEGVMTMKEGGRRKLTIPPALGYGARGAGALIPPNSVLIFDVELLKLK